MHLSPCSKLSNSRSSSPNRRQLSHCRTHVLNPKIRLKRALQPPVSPRAGQEAQAGDSGLDLRRQRGVDTQFWIPELVVQEAAQEAKFSGHCSGLPF